LTALLAGQYLPDPTLSLIEIAFLLGFSEQSAFSRACRRWFGKPPSALRTAADEQSGLSSTSA
jgi:AraC-like DNA-binding protein